LLGISGLSLFQSPTKSSNHLPCLLYPPFGTENGPGSGVFLQLIDIVLSMDDSNSECKTFPAGQDNSTSQSRLSLLSACFPKLFLQIVSSHLRSCPGENMYIRQVQDTIPAQFKTPIRSICKARIRKIESKVFDNNDEIIYAEPSQDMPPVRCSMLATLSRKSGEWMLTIHAIQSRNQAARQRCL
jgi:hypothetical protein